MKLEVGKSYTTRDGERVLIIDKNLNPPYYLGDNFMGYLESGRRYHILETPYDLVTEIKKITIYI